MRVLVLGGAGFIGLHLARRLMADGCDVTIVDDFSRGAADEAVAAIGRFAEVRAADLTEAGAYDTLQGPYDQVYALAAVVGVGIVERDPARVMRVNTLATLRLMEWLPRGTRVFYASTSEVYADGVRSGQTEVPTAEHAPAVVANVAAPRSAYAVTKLWGEAAVAHFAAERDAPHVVGRFHNVYGPRMGTSHVIPELTLRALRREDPFRVYGVDQTRSFCHVDDAVDAMVRLMGTDAAIGEIVNIGDDTGETRIRTLAEMVLRIADHDADVCAVPPSPGSVPRRLPDITKLRQLTGYTPRVPLPDGLRSTFEWYQDWHGRRPYESGSFGLSP